MSREKCSLILMYDDGRTHRMRLSSAVFRLLVTLLVVAPLLALLGIWAGYEGWHTSAGWRAEKRDMEKQLDEMRLRLERLATLEDLMESEGVPVRASAQNETPPESAPTPPDRKPETGQAAVAAAPSPEPAAEAAAAAAPAPNEPEAVDTGVILVENVEARMVDRRRIRASADIRSGHPGGRQLVGRLVFSVLTGDGKTLPLSNEDAAFRIARFRKVTTTSPLPQLDAAELDNARILVEATIGGKLAYRHVYPLAKR